MIVDRMQVFPVCAGMALSTRHHNIVFLCVPRVYRDGPMSQKTKVITGMCSPCVRGCPYKFAHLNQIPLSLPRVYEDGPTTRYE